MAAAGAAALAAAQRMVHRVHHHAADLRTASAPAVRAGLADRLLAVVDVADLADGRHALAPHHPHLGGGHAQRDVIPFLGDDLYTGPGGTGHLPTRAAAQLDVVNGRAERDLRKRQGIADSDVGTRPGDHRLPDCEAHRVEDVPPLAVLVLDQRDVGAAVRIVLDRHDPARNPVLVATEVDDPVLPLVTAAATAHR